MSKEVLAPIATEAQELLPWILERRRHLHRHPELSFKEVQTSAFLRREVEGLGLKPKMAVEGKNGFFADLKSAKNPENFLLLRADMDALPIQEENDVEYKSTIPGIGHLCGHDTHVSMLLGAMNILRTRVETLPYSVRFVFQHAEEVSPGGARDFVEAGLTNDVVGCFGIHVSPRVVSGHIGLRSGPAMAAAGSFVVTMRGRGGHGAAPHETIDPMPAAAASILNLQQIVARRLPPNEPGVVSVCQIHGGSAHNVIPDEIIFTGTYRSFIPSRVKEIEQMIREIISSTAATYGCVASVELDSGYPPLINDEKATEASRAAITALFGADCPQTIPQSMGGEDFSYFALQKPSSFVFLGVRPEEAQFYPLHHAKFLPDESQLWKGSALLAAIPFVAGEYLGK